MRFGGLDGVRTKYKKKSLSSVVISIVFFAVATVLFLEIVGMVNKESVDEQKKTLEAAIEKSIVQCYVTEGRYPESIDYLQNNYGITYDHELFRVDYSVFGTNIRPNVTVITLEE